MPVFIPLNGGKVKKTTKKPFLEEKQKKPTKKATKKTKKTKKY